MHTYKRGKQDVHVWLCPHYSYCPILLQHRCISSICHEHLPAYQLQGGCLLILHPTCRICVRVNIPLITTEMWGLGLLDGLDDGANLVELYCKTHQRNLPGRGLKNACTLRMAYTL